jgi:phosphatidylglycerol:prolipoprotein diacylglycerol transferase
LLPYVQIPDWEIVSVNAFGSGWPAESFAIRPFGALVVLAVALGVYLSLRQARQLHLRRERLITLMYFVVVGGFLVGHWFDVAFYSPDLIETEPRIWLALAQGQSSFGGFMGAIAGAFLFRALRGAPLFPLAEVVASSFPAAWVVGRIGCAVAHDHPGVRSDLWFAVAYPAGGRLDLGLLEAVFVLPLAVAFLWLRRKPRPVGFYSGAMCIYYAIVRFWLDFLRANDVPYADQRYAALTPAQWGTLVLFGVGVYFSSRTRSVVSTRTG